MTIETKSPLIETLEIMHLMRVIADTKTNVKNPTDQDLATAILSAGYTKVETCDPIGYDD